jgi:hypothetical protein
MACIADSQSLSIGLVMIFDDLLANLAAELNTKVKL